MSNNESFIDEVTEEVRKDQLFTYMRRYGWIAVLAILVLVGGTAFSEFRKAQAERVAQQTGDAILAALEIDDDAQRAAALAAVEADGGAAAIAGLLAAADFQETGDIDGAASVLADVAALDGIPQIYKDLAALKSVMVQGDSMEIDARRAALAGLATPGQPFRLIAEEQLALLDIEAGDTEAAIDRLRAIADDAEGTRGLRDRALGLIVSLGGSFEDNADISAQTDE